MKRLLYNIIRSISKNVPAYSVVGGNPAKVIKRNE